MATFEVTIENITVHPHPNADRLEYAQVGLYNVVVPKGAYNTGDEVFYIPEFAVLPEKLITELGLEGKLAGRNKDRVKPIKLRGLLSQGLVAPLTVLSEKLDRTQQDYAELLGVKKWEPEVPASLAGNVKSAPELVRWIDIENIKKHPDMFQEGELVVVDEKIHGTATCVTVVNPNNDDKIAYVTSKGIGAKNLALQEDPKNAYWRMYHQYNLEQFAAYIHSELTADELEVTKVALFGETYGSIQDLHYGTQGLAFALFDIHVTFINTERWLNPEEVIRYATTFGMPKVPTLYEGPFSLKKIEELAYGPEQVSGTESNIREGVVVRPAEHNANKEYEGRRKIGKYVSDDYLTRSNGTEYN